MTNDPHPSSPAGARFFTRLGMGAIIAVVGFLVVWSTLAPIEGAVVAGGQVTVESNRKDVQHLEGGVIGSLEVREGDLVRAGDIVAHLEDTVQKANAALIEGQLTELYARRARLESERDGADAVSRPRGRPEILDSLAFGEKLEGQKRLFEARRTTRIKQLSLLEERITQQSERIGGLNAQISALRSQLELIKDELENVRALHAEGYAPTTRLRGLEREEKRLAGERGSLSAAVAEAESVIAEAKLEIERLKAASREEAISELRDVEVSISELEERRITALGALRRTEIRAPQSGRVLALRVHTVGGVIAPGASLMEIVPDGDRLQIAVRVAPQNIDKVRAGQDTLVRFSAFGSRSTPEATGVVRTISADALSDESGGAPYFLVLIDIPEDKALSSILGGKRLIPGMPVEAFIRTGSRPAISYLLKPLTDSLARSMREE